ncbi:MAG TPA: glycosyltransferase family 2 protein [Candidatus Dormibacteraeota bacterium]|nr:glycosyltransferase family 2 protein [Candidatus Dormibacteraeota bacterium]
MIGGRRVAVVLPAYNAEQTLARTVAELDREIADDILLVDDASTDATADLGRQLSLHVVSHPYNVGYGGNQKTCYQTALARGADIVVMVHPDYQYSPRRMPSLAAMVASGEYEVVLASRILGNGAIRGGMPRYKYLANRFLTATENLLLGPKLSEFHTGYRAYSREVLTSLRLQELSDNFVFDNQILAQALAAGFRIGEISCPTRYETDSSSIGPGASLRYGFGVVATAFTYRLHVLGWRQCPYLIPLVSSARFRDGRPTAGVFPHDAS